MSPKMGHGIETSPSVSRWATGFRRGFSGLIVGEGGGESGEVDYESKSS